MAKKSVVVLGAGFGGLQAVMGIAKGLRKLKLLEKYEVVLVDRNDCHLYVPLLYKLAASSDNDYEKKCTYDVNSLIKNLPIRFVRDEITKVEPATGDISLKNAGTLHADYLVIALGSETNYFGIPGLKENSLQLKTVETALQVRAAVSKAFAKGGNIKIIAGGAGPNGIELASEIRSWADRAEEENSNLHVSVSIVEAMSSILPGLNPRVAAHAAIRLEKLNIKVLLNKKISGVTPTEIQVGAAEGQPPAPPIPFDVFIWTGGLKTPEAVTAMPLEKEPRGKPVAKADMGCAPGTPDLKLAPMVYGIGDNVCFMNPKTGKPVPAVARAAILEAGVAAHNLLEEIKKSENANYQPHIKNFIPSDYPYVIPVGENWGSAKFGPFVFWGWPGAMFEKLIALHYLASIMPLDEAFTAWKAM